MTPIYLITGSGCVDIMGPFKSFIIDNKAFCNLFCNPQKSFHTSPTRIIEAVNHSSNSTIAFTKKLTSSRKFSSKCYCWVWRMVDSLYYSSRKIPERCENSFVDCRINYQKLCYLMRQITKDLNSANVILTVWGICKTTFCRKLHRNILQIGILGGFLKNRHNRNSLVYFKN